MLIVFKIANLLKQPMKHFCNLTTLCASIQNTVSINIKVAMKLMAKAHFSKT